MDIKKQKRKMIAIFKYPSFFKHIMTSEDVFTGGCGIVFVRRKKVIKIRIKKREEAIKYEMKKRGFLTVATLDEEKNKFETFNNRRKCSLENNVLTMPRIEGVRLEEYIDTENFFHYFALSIETLMKYNLYHGDFHPGNILLNGNNVYFIDFEYKYTDVLKNIELEADILKFIFYVKRYYGDFYMRNIKHFKMIFDYFEKENLIYARNIMKCYLKDEINEIFK